MKIKKKNRHGYFFLVMRAAEMVSNFILCQHPNLKQGKKYKYKTKQMQLQPSVFHKWLETLFKENEGNLNLENHKLVTNTKIYNRQIFKFDYKRFKTFQRMISTFQFKS